MIRNLSACFQFNSHIETKQAVLRKLVSFLRVLCCTQNRTTVFPAKTMLLSAREFWALTYCFHMSAGSNECVSMIGLLSIAFSEVKVKYPPRKWMTLKFPCSFALTCKVRTFCEHLQTPAQISKSFAAGSRSFNSSKPFSL